MGKMRKKQKSSDESVVSVSSSACSSQGEMDMKLTKNINGCEILQAAKEYGWETQELVRNTLLHSLLTIAFSL